ncbi:MAG TPA: protein kinase [Kofleriaceae bacterium]|jgi:tetratricopeptide (TPR) repeat protein/tRNA A-37 threonylcarbamoyl transferase component Bud32|nr:protein kinase [Kofleriaceae bacterium]
MAWHLQVSFVAIVIDEIVKGFRVTAKLGRGGMGEVWVAEQPLVRTRVAIKLLIADVSTDSAQVQRFFNEAVAASKIKHAGIVKIFDVGFHVGRAFLIMELLEGEPLSARLRRLGRLPTTELLEVARQLASVLAATHDAGITHRDLKPDNVFLVADAELPGGERAKVLDFGIAKLAGAVSGMTAAGGSMGTPAYMAPEQWTDAASADARADVYSLGCLMFEMACGRPPFIATTIGETCTKHLTEVPVRVRTLAPAIPAELDELIARMLEKLPAHRPTMMAVAAVVARVVANPLPATLATGESPLNAMVETTLQGAAGTAIVATLRRRRSAPFVIGGVAIAAASVGLVVAHTPRDAAATAPIVVPAPPNPAPIAEPTLGLAAVEHYHDPTSATVNELSSESLWIAARDDFADACQRAPGNARWCAARDFADSESVLVMTDRDLSRAVASAKHAIATDPTWAMPLVALSAAQSYQHDTDNALSAARLAQRIDPMWWTAIAAGARVYAYANRMDDAIQEYRRALTLAPKNAVLLAEVALCYHGAGMDTQAAKYGDAALAIDDSLVAVHVMRAELRLEANDGKGALAESELALGESPKNGAAHLARGDAYALLHDKARAFLDYKRAIELQADQQANAPAARMKIVADAVAQDVLPSPRGARPADVEGTRTRTLPSHDRPLSTPDL